MRIKKFNNVFGIKSLEIKDIDLNARSNYLIYSPNGTMKTSFSDGISAIFNNQIPTDLLTNKKADFEIELSDGTIINKPVLDGKVEVVVEKANDYEGIFDSTYLSDDSKVKFLYSMAISDSVKKELNNIDKEGDEKEEKAKEALSNKVKKNRREDKALDVFDIAAKKYPYLSLMKHLKDLVTKNNDEKLPLSTKDIFPLFDTGVIKELNDETFRKEINDYKKTIEFKYGDEFKDIFKSGFGIESLRKVVNSAKENHFFSAGHKLLMNNKNYDENAVDDLIKEIDTKVYGSPESINAIGKLSSKLDQKNMESLKAFVTGNKEYIPNLLDYRDFFAKVIVDDIGFDLVNNFAMEKKNLDKKINDIQEKALKERNQWDDTVEEFNKEFSSLGFTAKIENENTLLKDSIPKIVLTDISNGKPLPPDMHKRLSNGEKNALRILNYIFDIKRAQSTGKNVLVVLDDIADSFDYKNKSAFIDYISEFVSTKTKEVSNFTQFIIFTHSFDVYRDIIDITKDNLVPLMAYKKTINSIGGDVYLVKDKGCRFHIIDINRWLGQKDPIKFFAYLPFARIIYQIEEKTQKSKIVIDLNSLIHFPLSDSPKTFKDAEEMVNEDIKSLKAEEKFAPFPISNEFAYKNTFDVLKDLALKIDSLEESDLDKKILLATFIRQTIEKISIERLAECGVVLEDKSIRKNQTRELVDLYINKISKDEISKKDNAFLNTSLSIANSYLHINNLLEGPLVDYGPFELISIKNKWEANLKDGKLF